MLKSKNIQHSSKEQVMALIDNFLGTTKNANHQDNSISKAMDAKF